MSDEWWPNLRCRWCRSKTEQPRLKRAAFKVRRDCCPNPHPWKVAR